MKSMIQQKQSGHWFEEDFRENAKNKQNLEKILSIHLVHFLTLTNGIKAIVAMVVWFSKWNFTVKTLSLL